MNKVYTIGRDTSCDIVIQDTTDVVSRLHASLKAKGNGKYVIIDQSRNGTYVNGIKMAPNEEIPITRKDVISFAHVRDLDWNQIPKDKDSKKLWIPIVISIFAIACICYFFFKPVSEPVQPVVEETELPAVADESASVKDTTAKETIYIKKKAAVKPRKKKEKAEEKKEGKPTKEEPEVVNPLL